jgi:RNA polymerase sigma-70 factor (ECF subfamily)
VILLIFFGGFAHSGNKTPASWFMIRMKGTIEVSKGCPSDSPKQQSGRVPIEPLGASRFERWIEEHYQVVYRYAFRLSRDQTSAEDLTQQVFLNAWRHQDQLRDPGKSQSWLLTTTRNQFLKDLRKSRPVHFSKWEMEPGDLPAPSSQSCQEVGLDLQDLLLQMTPEYRVVLLMFFFEGLTYKEIAAELGIKLGTVMSRLSRAKQQLQGLWS